VQPLKSPVWRVWARAVERRERVDEDSDGDEIGPLSCYFPDAQVYQVRKGGITSRI
jgi:hypothetical protein